MPQEASRQAASLRPSSPARNGTMMPSSETAATTAAGSIALLAWRALSSGLPSFSKSLCSALVTRCSVLTDGVMPPILAKNDSASRAVQ